MPVHAAGDRSRVHCLDGYSVGILSSWYRPKQKQCAVASNVDARVVELCILMGGEYANQAQWPA